MSGKKVNATHAEENKTQEINILNPNSKSRACSSHAKQLEIQEMNMINSISVKHHVFKPMDNFTKHAYEQNMENSCQQSKIS